MIVAYLNNQELPPLEREFINAPIENAVDVVPLNGSIYTDFVNIDYSTWSLRWDLLSEDDYNMIRSIYESQFSSPYEYPTLSIPFYGITNRKARMYINEKNIWNNCGDVQNVEITLREA